MLSFCPQTKVVTTLGRPDIKQPLQKASHLGFPGGSDGKESACSAGDLDLICGSGGSPGKGNDYPLQYSCPENSTDTGAWWATVHGIAELETNEQLIYGETVETVTLDFSGLQNHCRW